MLHHLVEVECDEGKSSYRIESPSGSEVKIAKLRLLLLSLLNLARAVDMLCICSHSCRKHGIR